MSESSLAIAQASVAMQSASTRQQLQTEMVKQHAQQDQALATLLQQSSEQMKAALPEGQGQTLDITA